MTVPSEVTRIAYQGASALGPFTIPYYFLEDDDLLVIKTLRADGTQTTLTLTTDYTVTGAGEQAGGELTLTAAHGVLTSAYDITIVRDPDRLQETDYTPYDKFPAESHERALDKLTMIVQRVRDLIDRSLHLSDGLSGISTILPTPVADAILGWNAAATAVENKLQAGLVTVTAYTQTLLAAVDAAAARTVLGISTFMGTLLDDTTADAARTTLGIPTMTPPSQFLRKNAIICGDASINPCQRGTSFAAIASGAYGPDRWKYLATGTMVHTFSKNANAPTVAEAGVLATHCYLLDCTTADGAMAAGDFCLLTQEIEGYNYLPLAQKSMTLSFWHKHTLAGTYCVALRNSGTDRAYVAEYTQAVADTWEKATINISASPSAGTWDYTTGVGLRVHFTLACGATAQTTAGTWQTGSFFATANQVNATASSAFNFRIALVQLESGDVATPFEGRTFETEYALCRRYYQKSFPIGTAPVQNGGTDGCLAYRQAVGNQTEGVLLRHNPPMRTSPTITTYNPAAANALWRNISDGSDSGTATLSLASEKSVFVNNPAPATDEATDLIGIHWTAETEL